MKRLMVDVYKIIYSVTREKYTSVTLAIVYTSIVNFIVADGFFLLLEGWVPTKKLHRIFVSPYAAITLVALLLIGFLRMPPLKTLRKERQKKPIVIPIIVYSCVGMLLFLYLRYSDKMN